MQISNANRKQCNKYENVIKQKGGRGRSVDPFVCPKKRCDKTEWQKKFIYISNMVASFKTLNFYIVIFLLLLLLHLLRLFRSFCSFFNRKQNPQKMKPFWSDRRWWGKRTAKCNNQKVLYYLQFFDLMLCNSVGCIIGSCWCATNIKRSLPLRSVSIPLCWTNETFDYANKQKKVSQKPLNWLP